MTVAELISVLQELPPDFRVVTPELTTPALYTASQSPSRSSINIDLSFIPIDHHYLVIAGDIEWIS